MIEIKPGFWNIRGTYRIAGLLNVGTQASLVRRGSGGFVLLDTCQLDEKTTTAIDQLTGGGAAIEAILNLHPFHTLHVADVHARYPGAQLYGTRRHVERQPELPWQPLLTDSPGLHARFAEDFDFSVPAGVDFISANERVHFSSVLVYHHASRTIHVDDTFNYLPDGGVLGLTPLADTVSFHPTLSKALQHRPGAADEFRDWARDLIERWREAENLCAAHAGTLLARGNRGRSIHARLTAALEKVEDKLVKHAGRHGGPSRESVDEA